MAGEHMEGLAGLHRQAAQGQRCQWGGGQTGSQPAPPAPRIPTHPDRDHHESQAGTQHTCRDLSPCALTPSPNPGAAGGFGPLLEVCTGTGGPATTHHVLHVPAQTGSEIACPFPRQEVPLGREGSLPSPPPRTPGLLEGAHLSRGTAPDVARSPWAPSTSHGKFQLL